MQRLAIFSIIVAIVSGTGCSLDEFRQQGGFRNKPVDVPEVSPASRELSARVDALGHEFVAGCGHRLGHAEQMDAHVHVVNQ